MWNVCINVMLRTSDLPNSNIVSTFILGVPSLHAEDCVKSVHIERRSTISQYYGRFAVFMIILITSVLTLPIIQRND